MDDFDFPHDDYGVGHEYAGLMVNAYVGGHIVRTGDETDDQVWGVGVEFHDVTIRRTDRAAEVLRVLRLIERAEERDRRVEGHLADREYALRVMRTARALGIVKVYVTNGARRQDMTGQRYRRVHADDLQAWVRDVEATIRNGQDPNR